MRFNKVALVARESWVVVAMEFFKRLYTFIRGSPPVLAGKPGVLRLCPSSLLIAF
jgi:hypothetical protein